MADQKNDLYKENLYVSPLSLGEELPRLAAQARLLFATQSHFVPKVQLSADKGTFLDIGSGPGVHLALVRKLFPGYSFTGLELSEGLHQYAKLNYPDITWIQGSAYKLPFPDASFDVLQASFVFIHLSQPEVAMAEIKRVLKPGGTFFILDVDDSTFKGFASMEKMVKKHLEVYEGDRTIMSRMKSLTEKAGLTLIQEDQTFVDNKGKEEAPDIQYPNIHLGKMTFWAMFAFMGQRAEVQAEYESARTDYMGLTENHCEISVVFQAFRKK